jgi:leucyl-tRNA synthetase
MITRFGVKMSKSKGNVISPATYIDRYGADATRCYLLFMAPPDHGGDWTDEGVEGVFRFLARLWRLAHEVAEECGVRSPEAPAEPPSPDDLELLRKTHWAIDKVTNELAGRFGFNTAIAAVMELLNECRRRREAVAPETLHFATASAASLIFPFAPHTSAEAYEMLTGERVWEVPWPDADPRYLERDEVEIVVQVNGRLRDRFQAAAASERQELESTARERERVRAHIDGREVVKVVVVPGKLVNFVVR